MTSAYHLRIAVTPVIGVAPSMWKMAPSSKKCMTASTSRAASAATTFRLRCRTSPCAVSFDTVVVEAHPMTNVVPRNQIANLLMHSFHWHHCSSRRPNGSGVQRRGRNRVPKPTTILAATSEARKRRAGAGRRPLLRRVGRRPLCSKPPIRRPHDDRGREKKRKEKPSDGCDEWMRR